jgi:transposase
MDKLDEDAIHKLQTVAFMGAQSLFKEKIDVLFYDATTLYFESFVEDELKSKGFSKDKKFSEVQILLSVFVTQAGIPIGYEVFPGATYEGHTLLAALDNLQQRFAVNNVVFVADSGMLNAINTEALEEAGYKYIVGARIKNMSKDITKQILNKESYEPLTIRDEDYSYKIIDLARNQNLLVSYSAKRARKDAHDRSEALKKLMQKMKKSKKVQSIINASGYKKYLNINGNSSLEVSEEKIGTVCMA